MTETVDPNEVEVDVNVPEEEGEKYDGGEIPEPAPSEKKDDQ